MRNEKLQGTAYEKRYQRRIYRSGIQRGRHYEVVFDFSMLFVFKFGWLDTNLLDLLWDPTFNQAGSSFRVCSVFIDFPYTISDLAKISIVVAGKVAFDDELIDNDEKVTFSKNQYYIYDQND